MLHIILTIDYEIFGDGSGDVRKHMIKPMDKILSILSAYRVPITLMFEVSEYLKFLEYDDQITKDMGYSYGEEIKRQVLSAYKGGHDIQLHIHPQWVDAGYANKKWVIENPGATIQEFSSSMILDILSKGKRQVENLIHQIDPHYQCKAMRLTNLPWCQAPEIVLSPMEEAGLVVHSLATSEDPNNTARGYWYLDPGKRIAELPIHSVPMSPVYRFSPYRILTALYRLKYSKFAVTDVPSNQSGGDRKKFLERLESKSPVKWDFCKQSARQMIEFLEYGIEKYKGSEHEIPLVMISHSKDFFNGRNLDKFLNAAGNIDGVRFSTLGEFIQNHLTDL